MSNLRIQLLGSFQVWRDQHLIAPEEWPGHKSRQLLKILLTHRGRAVPVDQLIEWLWPDLAVASARNSLWVAINRLRRLLEPHLPTPSASTYVLTSTGAYLFAPAAPPAPHLQGRKGAFRGRFSNGELAVHPDSPPDPPILGGTLDLSGDSPQDWGAGGAGLGGCRADSKKPTPERGTAEVQIDVDEFLEHGRQGRTAEERGDRPAAIVAYRAAEALYHGDYLPEDLYEDWAIPAREQLRETFLDIENTLATAYMGQGDYREALVRCHRVLAHDACRESAWRLAMECYHRLGEQGQALRAFERCRTILTHELGVDPLPETLALHQRILRNDLQGGRGAGNQDDKVARWQGGKVTELSLITLSPCHLVTPSFRFPFVGRDQEWLLLGRLLNEAQNGRGRVVIVTGEPGIGKTRLLEEFAGLATARGGQVLAGRCYELEQNLAYAPIIEALASTLTRCSSAPLPRWQPWLRYCPNCAGPIPTYHLTTPCRRMRSDCVYSPDWSRLFAAALGAILWSCSSMTSTGPIHPPYNCFITWAARCTTNLFSWSAPTGRPKLTRNTPCPPCKRGSRKRA